MTFDCKFAKLALNCDMSGMVQPCHMTSWYLKDLQDGRHFNVATDNIETIWHSEHRKKLLKDHEQGIRNITCKVCWDAEDAGVESARQKLNRELKDVEVLESQPRIMVMKPGNLCNNACRSCNAHTSSMWYKSDYALDHQGKTFKEYLKFFKNHRTAYQNNSLLEKKFAEWEDNILMWDMYGGEPMIIPLFWKILDQALANNNVNQKTFNVHTNGMVYKSDLVEKFNRFKNANIGFSIDALGKKNDYIRYGSKWEKILENFDRYHKDVSQHNTVGLSIRTTLTPWNIYHYDELYDFFRTRYNTKAGGEWCFDKPWNDLRYIPSNVKKEILSKLTSYGRDDTWWQRNVSNIKKWMLTCPSDYNKLQNSFIQFNTKLDRIRSEKFADVFPEYSKLY